MVLAAAAVISGFAAWFEMSRRLPGSAVEREVRENGAIVVSAASIRHRWPNAPALIGNDTLVMSDPLVIKSVEPLKPPCVLILPAGGWVVGQVDLLKRSVGKTGVSDLNAMLPSQIKIVKLDDAGRYTLLQSGRVNYLLIVPREEVKGGK